VLQHPRAKLGREKPGRDTLPLFIYEPVGRLCQQNNKRKRGETKMIYVKAKPGIEGVEPT